MSSERVRRLVRPGMFGGSPEWTAGVRRWPAAVVAAVVVLAVCACIPYAGFPALYLAAVACGVFYTSNEPLQFLLLPGMGAARLLTRKVLTAWRNYFLMTAPFAVLTFVVQPRSAWMAAAWAPLAALVLLRRLARRGRMKQMVEPEPVDSTAEAFEPPRLTDAADPAPGSSEPSEEEPRTDDTAEPTPKEE